MDTSLNFYGFVWKTGGSTADDVVDYCENQLTLFAISYCEAVFIVTDTEPTMIAAGQILVRRSLKGGGKNKMARGIWPFAAVSNQKSIFQFTQVRRDTQGISKSGQFF